MKYGCYYSNSLEEISQIHIKNTGWYYKEDVHDYLKVNPHTIQVDHYPYPFLKPDVSYLGEKYVRSEANGTVVDNLLSLPRE